MSMTTEVSQHFSRASARRGPGVALVAWLMAVAAPSALPAQGERDDGGPIGHLERAIAALEKLDRPEHLRRLQEIVRELRWELRRGAIATTSLPDGVRGFSGQVTGVVTAARDDGTFSLEVSRVTRVWKDNRATDVEWFLGRTIVIGPGREKGDDGQGHANELHAAFIRRLRVHEDYRLEIQDAGRDGFRILELNERQRELARGGAEAESRDERRLPEAARGFSGQVAGIVDQKHDDGSFTFAVVKVLQVWDGSKAREPFSLAGKTVRVAPRWVKGDDGQWRPYQLHAAFIDGLVGGEDYRLEIQNAELDHFQILELSEPQRESARRRGERDHRED